MIPRRWTREQLERSIPWLRRMNGRDHDVYIRPGSGAGASVGLVLVDDLTAAAVARMVADGVPPALVLETSPHNFQAWVRLSPTPISAEDATLAARVLAARYGGDPNSADWRHYGRLAGFTNRKPGRRRPDGQQPYVLVREASGATAQNALQGLLRDAETRKPRHPAIGAPRPPQRRLEAPLDAPGVAYARRAEIVRLRYPTPDESVLDWVVCKALASSSLEVDQTYLERALFDGSPNLEERKRGHVEDYVRRTARKVLQEPEVIAAREFRAGRERQRERRGERER
jgi:hypothetical protein